MVRHVVVGWDGSKAAVGALQWAARHYPEAQQLEVVEVQGDRRDRAPHSDPGETVDAIRAAHPDLDVHVTVEHGVVAGVLAARTAPDDLVVLGGRGNEESRLGHRTSTAYRVVLEADGPVAVVPQSFTGGRDVVVGVLGRSDAPCVALTGANEAARRRQRLIAVHAVRPLLGLGLGALPGDTVDRDHIEAETERMVDEVLAPVREQHPGLPVVRHVRRGRPSDVLLAESHGAALLVLGTDDAARADRRPVTHSSMLLSRAPVIVVPPNTVVG